MTRPPQRRRDAGRRPAQIAPNRVDVVDGLDEVDGADGVHQGMKRTKTRVSKANGGAGQFTAVRGAFTRAGARHSNGRSASSLTG